MGMLLVVMAKCWHNYLWRFHIKIKCKILNLLIDFQEKMLTFLLKMWKIMYSWFCLRSVGFIFALTFWFRFDMDHLLSYSTPPKKKFNTLGTPKSGSRKTLVSVSWLLLATGVKRVTFQFRFWWVFTGFSGQENPGKHAGPGKWVCIIKSQGNQKNFAI